jgi:hypothetical protein
VGKETRPKREELEFLFNLFLKGYQDTDILAKYLELEEDGKLTFPLRTDRRMVSKIRDEFEAARAVLEPHLRLRIDPAVQKAQDEHLQKIQLEIQRWKVSLHIPDVASPNTFEYSNNLHSITIRKNNPVFKRLPEHLPRPGYDALWDDYDHWEKIYIEYQRLHESLCQQILKEADVRFKFTEQREREADELKAARDAMQSSTSWQPPESRFSPHAAESFPIPFFTAIRDKSLGKEIKLKFDPPLRLPFDDTEMLHDQLVVNDMKVLISENISGTNQSKYETMVKEYLISSEVADLIELTNTLRKLTDQISLVLDEILERRDYIRHTCRLCPASDIAGH